MVSCVWEQPWETPEVSVSKISFCHAKMHKACVHTCRPSVSLFLNLSTPPLKTGSDKRKFHDAHDFGGFLAGETVASHGTAAIWRIVHLDCWDPPMFFSARLPRGPLSCPAAKAVEGDETNST